MVVRANICQSFANIWLIPAIADDQFILMLTFLAAAAFRGVTSWLDSWLSAAFTMAVNCETWTIGVTIGGALREGAKREMRSRRYSSTPWGRTTVKKCRLNFYIWWARELWGVRAIHHTCLCFIISSISAANSDSISRTPEFFMPL